MFEHWAWGRGQLNSHDIANPRSLWFTQVNRIRLVKSLLAELVAQMVMATVLFRFQIFFPPIWAVCGGGSRKMKLMRIHFNPAKIDFKFDTHQSLFWVLWGTKLRNLSLPWCALKMSRERALHTGVYKYVSNFRSPGGGHGFSLQSSCLEHPHGQRSLAGHSPWGCKQSDTPERLTLSLLHFTCLIYLTLSHQNVNYSRAEILG